MMNKLGILPRPEFLPVYFVALLCLCGCNSASFRGLSFWKLTGDETAIIEETMSDSEFSLLTGWHESYVSAKLSAVGRSQPILVGFTGSDWCVPCKRLKKDVFDAEEFMTWAAENVVLLELDYPKKKKQSRETKEQNETLKRRYQISKYPTILLLDSEGEVLGEINTAKHATPAAFIENVNSILGDKAGRLGN